MLTLMWMMTGDNVSCRRNGFVLSVGLMLETKKKKCQNDTSQIHKLILYRNETMFIRNDERCYNDSSPESIMRTYVSRANLFLHWNEIFIFLSSLNRSRRDNAWPNNKKRNVSLNMRHDSFVVKQKGTKKNLLARQ